MVKLHSKKKINISITDLGFYSLTLRQCSSTFNGFLFHGILDT